MSKEALYNLYTKKQIEVLNRAWTKDFFICGLHGAKRSGKTVINNDIFIQELLRVREIADEEGIKEPIYILAGTSSTSIQNNILQELYNKYEFQPNYDKHGAFRFQGVKVVQIYTGSIAGLKRARGFTAYGAYINEASLANEEVFKEIISRCSGRGARIIWDSNPDNPNHWLKRDYINTNNDMIIDFHFKLEDNTFLNERYIESIKEATPNGKFYDRDILGLWTIAEGTVYTDYNQKHNEVDKAPDGFVRFYAGVDWGYEHNGVIIILGEGYDGKTYIIDGVAEKNKHIDFWKKKAKEYISKYGNIPFYCDTARPEHIADFNYNGIKAIFANKNVISGIEEVAKRFKNNELMYVKNTLPLFEDEIYKYRWKSNSNRDEVVKEDDDVMDALRYAIYTQHYIDTYNSNPLSKRDLQRIKNMI